MNKFIVLSTQRSGSSYLCEMLDRHSRLRCYEELFMPKNRNPLTYRSYRTARLSRRVRDWLNRPALTYEYLESIFESSEDLDAVGFKFMYGQDRRFPSVLRWCMENRVRVVHLVRENVLKILVSREIARRRGVYLATSKPPPLRIELETSTLVPRLEAMHALTERYRGMAENFVWMESVYERLSRHFNSETRRILQFLGTDPGEALSGRLVKTSPDSLADLIENYDDVRAALSDTRFAGLVA